jgi:hypothetical protein
MRRNIRSVASNCTANLSAKSTAVAFDQLDRKCRAAADEWIRRDASNVAAYAGLGVHTVQTQREYREDVIPALAKVARIVMAGLAIGRTFEDVAGFLLPVTEAAGCDLEPRPEIAGSVGVDHASSNALRNASDAIEAMADARMTRAECSEIEAKAQRTIHDLHRLILEARSAVKEPGIVRGKLSKRTA